MAAQRDDYEVLGVARDADAKAIKDAFRELALKYHPDRNKKADTEEAVYKALGLPFIEPELREDRGEIEAARSGTLPRLLQLSDLRGDLHAHTKDSDGGDPIAAMAEAARARSAVPGDHGPFETPGIGARSGRGRALAANRPHR